jgi:Multicopper oxidase
VNRMMGLHGALVVMPAGRNGTPYGRRDLRANPRLSRLFADLGRAPHWPGLAWGEGADNPDPFPGTPAFRQYIWLLHEASPMLFAEVGDARPGRNFDAATFMQRFISDRVTLNGTNQAPEENRTPQYFTVNGQSGHFVHGSAFMTPHLRVGEPCVIRILNAGLWAHSMHIHANHVYVLAVNNRFRFQQDVLPGQTDNHIWVDTFMSRPLDVFDWLLPYMRPPDIPNARGIGLPDRPRRSNAAPIDQFGDDPATLQTPRANRTWPPLQEVHMCIPPLGTTSGDGRPMHLPLSPVCFPMHDHSEPSQTAQGGNYNMGLIAGMNFIGDRTIDADGVHTSNPNRMVTFQHAPRVAGARATGPAAGPRPPFDEVHHGTV